MEDGYVLVVLQRAICLNGLPVQKESPIAIIRDTLKTKGVAGLYSGCTALVVGNSLKAGVRFVTYDYFKHKLADDKVGTRVLLGGNDVLSCG